MAIFAILMLLIVATAFATPLVYLLTRLFFKKPLLVSGAAGWTEAHICRKRKKQFLSVGIPVAVAVMLASMHNIRTMHTSFIFFLSLCISPSYLLSELILKNITRLNNKVIIILSIIISVFIAAIMAIVIVILLAMFGAFTHY